MVMLAALWLGVKYNISHRGTEETEKRAFELEQPLQAEWRSPSSWRFPAF